MQALSFAANTEKELRRQIDRSVSRALVDGDFAQSLLSNPAVAVEERGCTPQQYKQLLQIHASSLSDFAHQAQSLFWSIEPASRSIDNRRLLATAGTR